MAASEGISEEEKNKVRALLLTFTAGVVTHDTLKKFKKAKDSDYDGMPAEKKQAFKQTLMSMDMPDDITLQTICKNIMAAMKTAMVGTAMEEGSEPCKEIHEAAKANVLGWAQEQKFTPQTHAAELPTFMRAFVGTCAALVFKTRLDGGKVPEAAYAGWDQ